ncbi:MULTISPECIES: DUF1127 domain-containing protein [Pantoea]|uniref:DUF1127 domain-containing protein n=1 Tax=Pantoea TaxID=53335 RepID=UPI000736894F|nr:MULTISPECIES: DUF1127 domain-containing protein [Pantoea]KTS27197.1 hypothetical protein NS381_13970 [Pantoea stewartii]PXV70722.1 uncharacterized protein DUF1127 [Pantoea sp. PNA 03-3]WRH15042.1 DUF1127 domain-containing protein [Pantoea sp. JZ2]
MEYEENRSAKPFAVSLSLFRFIWHHFRRWQCRRETRMILCRLSDSALKDIGLKRSDINKRF